MNDKRKGATRRHLLAWYDVEARDLPWRRTRDPYAILISEVMLQQTRVETVLRYYEPFLARFPTFRALAAAPLDEVLKAWEGLGYYRRAQNLHRAAQAIVAEHSGRLPKSASGLRALPGIGPYTAGAVASIAFDLDEPVLDGNVVRVLARLFRVSGDPGKSQTQATLRALAEDLLPQGDASRFNQGLMDLGARICLPRSPRCHECPLSSECDAHHKGEEAAFPERPRRKTPPHIDVVAGVIWSREPYERGAEILIAKRRADDMLGGLWEFPGGRVEAGETFESALARELHEELAIDVDVIEPLLAVQHAYTHFRMTMHVFHCRHSGGSPQAIECDDWTWTTVDRLDEYALSIADRKVAAALETARLARKV